MDRGAWRATVLGVLRVGHNLVTKSLSDLVQFVNRELPDVQAGFRRQRNQRSNCQHLLDHQKIKRVPEKHLLLLLTMPKPLTV